MVINTIDTPMRAIEPFAELIQLPWKDSRLQKDHGLASYVMYQKQLQSLASEFVYQSGQKLFRELKTK